MKLFIDDIRPCPDGWVVARTYDEAIEQLMTFDVEEVSFDHDLGEEETGYDILCWLENMIYSDEEFEKIFPIPIFYVHSSNPVGRKRMQQVISSIEKKRK